MEFFSAKWSSCSDSQTIAEHPSQFQPKSFGLPPEMANFDRRDVSAVLPQNTRSLHDEVHAVSGASPELIITVMLTTSAVATQCLFDVEYLDIFHCPTSLAGCYIASSGSGKTTTNNELTQAHRDFQFSESISAREQHELKAEQKIWEAKERALLKKIDKSLDDDERLLQLKTEYAALLKAKPSTVKTAENIMHRDVNYPSLVQSLEVQSACTSWVHDEATPILSDLRRLMPHLSQSWDGTFIKRERMTSDPVYQAEPRVSISWGMQPKRFATYVKEHGADLIDVGLGARMLIAVSRAMPSNTRPRNMKVVREARDRHYANLTRIFKRYAEMMRTRSIERMVLTLASAAQVQFQLTLKWISKNKTGKGYLSKIPEFANRIAENILRVAANLHVIEERAGTEIELDILQSAIQLMMFYTEQHMALFGDINTPVDERHAAVVLDLLIKVFNEWELSGTPMGVRTVGVRTIQQYAGSMEIRQKKANVVAALMVLERQRIVFPLYGPRSEMLGVTLNDGYFRQQFQNRPRMFYLN
ncbi:MAG TPA: DUF3987 domain-containing protein [Burkholderiaceae bacterium]|nr:DUF3987 domain-containing protein [Burkholderiaceae bacterium]